MYQCMLGSSSCWAASAGVIGSHSSTLAFSLARHAANFLTSICASQSRGMGVSSGQHAMHAEASIHGTVCRPWQT